MNVTAVCVVAIISWAIVQLANGRKSKKTDQITDKEVEVLRQQVSEMKERIETLEKIITDDNYDLRKQFADLERDKVA